MIGKTIVEGEARHIDIAFDVTEANVADVVVALQVGDAIAMAPATTGLLFPRRSRQLLLRALHEFIEKRVEMKQGEVKL